MNEPKLPDGVQTCPTCGYRFGGFANGQRIECEDGIDDEIEVLPRPDSHEARTLCLTCATQEAFEAATRKPNQA